MDIFEMIELAKKSEHGATWYSDKGPINISKEGNLTPIKLKELPKYQPERLSPEANDESFFMYHDKIKTCIDTALSCYGTCLETNISEQFKNIFIGSDSPNSENK